MISLDSITVDRVSKKFRLYHRRPAGLKEQLLSSIRGERSVYEELWALRDVSLVVKAGEMVGLIGTNGSGKSTLLQVIAGIYTPDAGHVVVNGRLRALLELGTGFNHELSGRENVLLNGALMGFSRSEIRKRFDSIVSFAELDRFVDMPLKTYSSGMQMRLAFAIAVHLDPEILILDEVLAVGDDHFYRKCLRRVHAIREAGSSILLVSHGLTMVEQLCDRVYLLDEGRLVAEGTPTEVLSQYRAATAVSETEASSAAEGTGTATPKRWGTGEVRITRVAVCGPDGKPSSFILVGQPMTVRIEFEAAAAVHRPVFGIAIRTDDGALVTGPNTKMSGFATDAVRGGGAIEYRVAQLPLVPGSYLVECAVYDEKLLTAYDHWEQCAKFMVLEAGVGERFGVVVLDASWQLID